MFEAVAVTYGMLLSFVLSSATRNKKLARPNAPMVMHLGYVLFGITVTMALVLAGYAAWGLATGRAVALA